MSTLVPSHWVWDVAKDKYYVEIASQRYYQDDPRLMPQLSHTGTRGQAAVTVGSNSHDNSQTYVQSQGINDYRGRPAGSWPQTHSGWPSNPSSAVSASNASTVTQESYHTARKGLDPSTSSPTLLCARLNIPEFKRRNRGFFTPGKVIKVLWVEPAGEAHGTHIHPVDFQEHAHSKICWFVIVRDGGEGTTYSLCLRISTYYGDGVAKAGVVKAQHAIIHTGEKPPSPEPNENPTGHEEGMRKPIRIRPTTRTEKMDTLSRLNYGKVYTIEHKMKAYEFGNVHEKSMRRFERGYEKVRLLQDLRTGSPSSTENEDSDGEEDQRQESVRPDILQYLVETYADYLDACNNTDLAAALRQPDNACQINIIRTIMQRRYGHLTTIHDILVEHSANYFEEREQHTQRATLLGLAPAQQTLVYERLMSSQGITLPV